MVAAEERRIITAVKPMRAWIVASSGLSYEITDGYKARRGFHMRVHDVDDADRDTKQVGSGDGIRANVRTASGTLAVQVVRQHRGGLEILAPSGPRMPTSSWAFRSNDSTLPAWRSGRIGPGGVDARRADRRCCRLVNLGAVGPDDG